MEDRTLEQIAGFATIAFREEYQKKNEPKSKEYYGYGNKNYFIEISKIKDVRKTLQYYIDNNLSIIGMLETIEQEYNGNYTLFASDFVISKNL